MRRSSAIFIATLCLGVCAYAQGFKFSNPSPEEQAQAAQEQRQRDTVDWQLSTPCRDRIKNRKIMVLIGEERNGMVTASQGSYSRHVDAICPNRTS